MRQPDTAVRTKIQPQISPAYPRSTRTIYVGGGRTPRSMCSFATFALSLDREHRRAGGAGDGIRGADRIAAERREWASVRLRGASGCRRNTGRLQKRAGITSVRSRRGAPGDE